MYLVLTHPTVLGDMLRAERVVLTQDHTYGQQHYCQRYHSYYYHYLAHTTPK